MPVSKRLRYEVMKRDNHACRYCGAVAPDAKLTVDHVVPVALGGSDQPDNLVTACVDCNAGKSSAATTDTVIDDVKRSAFQWRTAFAYALDDWRQKIADTDDDLHYFEERWNRWKYQDHSGERESFPLPSDWRNSVTHWMSIGFTVDDLDGLICKSMEKQRLEQGGTYARWKWFCGIVWRTIDGLKDTAEAMATGPF